MARYPNNPNWGTHAYPGDGPYPPPDREPFDSGYDQVYAYPGDELNPPPDEAVFDSGYERDPAPPLHALEDPEEEPEEEIDNAFTRACHQALRNLIQPRQGPRETAGWEAPLPGHGPHGGEPYWGEDLDQDTWYEEETQLDPALPTDRDHRPELEEDDEDVPHCAQFADPRTMMKASKPPEDKGSVPHCAQFADADTIAAAQKQ